MIKNYTNIQHSKPINKILNTACTYKNAEIIYWMKIANNPDLFWHAMNLMNISGWFWNRVLHNDCACFCEGQELYNFSINLYLSMSSRSIMCRGCGAFCVIENKFCKASYECYFVLSVFLQIQNKLGWYLIFLNLLLNIHENPRRDKRNAFMNWRNC